MKAKVKIGIACLSSFLILGVAGCSGGGGSDTGEKAEAIYEKEDIVVYDDQKVNFKNIAAGDESTPGDGSQANAAATNYLLYGYNVINYGYMDSQNINKRYAILDGSKLLASDYNKVDSTRSDTTYLISNYASSLLEKFNTSASVKYKGALFSGGMKTEYGLSRGLDENEKLIKYLGFYRVYEQYLVANNTRIRELLTEQFKQDLADPSIGSDEMTPSGKTKSEEAIDTIFQNYGTHLIQQYYLGGRFDLNFNYTSSASVTDEDLKASVEAAYSGFSGNASADTKTKASKVTDHASTTFKAVGGMLITGKTPDEVSKQFPAWLDSLPTKNDICEIGSFDAAMLPIWELAGNDSVKKRLKDRFDVLLEQANKNLEGYDPVPKYITEIMVSADRDSDRALNALPTDAGWTKVLLNPGTNSTEVLEANKKAGGDFIYIAYKLSSDKSQALYDIYVDFGQYIGDFSKDGHDYKKIDVDLNRHAGGNYIWLFSSKAKSTDTKFVKEIRGTYGSSSLPSGWQWTRDQVDLNRGVRGSWDIFLAFRTGS